MLLPVAKRLYRPDELGSLAKQARERAKKTKEEAACELGVKRTSVQLAEENPEQSLFQLRKRIVERYSGFEVVGPVYYLKKKAKSD